MPFELVAKSSSERIYRTELKRFVCFWLWLFRLLPMSIWKIIGYGLKKHQFRALRELWVNDVWQSAEHIDLDAAVDKDEGHDEDEREYEDEDEDEIQADDDDSDEKEGGDDENTTR
ncbi:hypothetical protein FNYG_08786 [Fusarium nygamai]|uniref:Uncharacterized protein n=1 Tax=Gibberella nygamai TaxID=42673 RepID=A0A2K0W6H4_GIBNY|nr:hypothetical protein FNYG_08786 [Fusarium nygamai]